VDISMAGGWGDRTPRTQVVAIGVVEAIDYETLWTTFEQCAIRKAEA
jgi:hypothetical protein